MPDPVTATTVASTTTDRDLDRILGGLINPALADLAAQLRSLPTLAAVEQEAVSAGIRKALHETLWRRIDRVVILELHAARLAGRLTATDSPGRWQEWIAGLERPGGWEALAEPYPPLLPRLRRLISNRCAAAFGLARRFGTDRADLAGLLGNREPGEMVEVSFGAGDAHRGGHTVSVLTCQAGRLVYKPRPLAVDVALAQLLPKLLPAEPAPTRIRVPAVIARQDEQGSYGWAAHVTHRYCADEQELHSFYRGLGHWLAIMRLLGGSDLHLENLIAAGPVPVVVDCETLFTPNHDAEPSGYGQAVDAAHDQVRRSAMRTGLLPGRGGGLAMRGADGSAAGGLPGEQPVVEFPAVVDFGTDQARLATGYGGLAPAANLPTPRPDLRRYWPVTVDAFHDLSRELRDRDRAGELWPLLAGFADCPVRVVLRDTASYEALERMLWHPKALHNPAAAATRAAELLTRHAENQPGAPGDPAVIDAEIAELLVGDVPAFTAICGSGVLEGPGDTRLGRAEDLVASALSAWRAINPAVERQVVQSALAGAYLNAELAPGGDRRVRVGLVRGGDLAQRRRSRAAAIMRQLAATAIRGEDGTVTWVAPGLDATGWAVRPLGSDLYNGVSGAAVLLAGYQREVAAGRAAPVTGLDKLLAGALATLRLADEQDERERVKAAEARIRLRPAPPGGYLGLGSRIWAWLVLGDLMAVSAEEAHQRAIALAGLLPAAVEADEALDLLSGAAGAIVPLLRLAERTSCPRWQELAHTIGRGLVARAVRTDAVAYWPTRGFPQGLGGLSHGVTGFGWALARLAAVIGDPGMAELAEAAFAHDETDYDQRLGGWRHPRTPSGTGVAWCHGSVGIGVAAADLLANSGGSADRLRDRLDRAARATWPAGFEAGHTLCHGTMSAWELLARAAAAGLDPPAALEQVEAELLTSLEDRGGFTGPTREPFAPTLLPGHGGAAYQLLRMHPECALPSLLLPDPGPGPVTGDPAFRAQGAAAPAIS